MDESLISFYTLHATETPIQLPVNCTLTMWHNLPPRYFFAHRGASAYAPENTLAAFQLALEQGAPAIEFDVKLTADRHVIVIHDSTLDRTTNGEGPVNLRPLDAIKQFDAGGWFGEEFKGEPIPTLDEVFSALGGKIFMNIELTNYTTPFDRLVDEVAELVEKYKVQDSIMFSSFFPTNLIRARKLLPQVPRGQLVFAGRAGWWQRVWGAWLDLQADHPFTSDVSIEKIAISRSKNRRVHVWTVNDPVDMNRLREIGVDAIFSDDPKLAASIFL
jgi:glycerophosphoryl diester phosphodiesterase